MLTCTSDPRKKRNHKLKLLGPDILWWGGVLPREGVGAKKFRFWPGFRGGAPKFVKKSLRESSCGPYAPDLRMGSAQ